jgi:hypothetical protein
VFKDPKYGISFSFSSDWKVVKPTEKLKISAGSDLRIFLEGPNGFVMARVDQWTMSLSKVDYEEGFDEFFGEILASRIRTYDHLNMEGSTVLNNKVTPSEIGLTFDISTTYTKSKKGPLVTIGKHFLPFENDFVVNLVAVGSPRSINIKEDALWKIAETFQIDGLSVIKQR